MTKYVARYAVEYDIFFEYDGDASKAIEEIDFVMDEYLDKEITPEPYENKMSIELDDIIFQQIKVSEF